MGRKDVQTPLESSPASIDSNPVKDLIAVYAKTGEIGKDVIIGYINKNQKALKGEIRLYATDNDGVEQSFFWVRKDGNIEINGDDDNMARFSELKIGFDKLKSDFNAFLTHVHGVAGTPPAPPAIPSTASIDSSKIDEVKTLKKQP